MSVLQFYGADDFARQLLEAQFSDLPVFAECPPMTLAGLLDPGTAAPLQIDTPDAMVAAEERALQEKGMFLRVLEPIGGGVEQSLMSTGIAIAIVENPDFNRLDPAGTGIAAKAMVRHVIAALVGQPGGHGGPEFRLPAGEVFGRLDGDGGVISYIVNLEIDILLR